MDPLLATALVVVAVALMVVQQIVFERNLRRARADGTGLFRFSPAVRRVVVVALLLALIGFAAFTWQ